MVFRPVDRWNEAWCEWEVMKITLSVLFTSFLTLASLAQAQSYCSLNGYLETIQVPAGQTFFVVGASSNVVLEIKSPGKTQGQQFRFRSEDRRSSYRLSGQNFSNVLPTPSTHNPFPISGPAKLTLRTSGILTVLMPEQRRKSFRSSTSSQGTVRRFASN